MAVAWCSWSANGREVRSATKAVRSARNATGRKIQYLRKLFLQQGDEDLVERHAQDGRIERDPHDVRADLVVGVGLCAGGDAERGCRRGLARGGIERGVGAQRVGKCVRKLETITALSLHANRYSEQIAEMVAHDRIDCAIATVSRRP